MVVDLDEPARGDKRGIPLRRILAAAVMGSSILVAALYLTAPAWLGYTGSSPEPATLYFEKDFLDGGVELTITPVKLDCTWDRYRFTIVSFPNVTSGDWQPGGDGFDIGPNATVDLGAVVLEDRTIHCTVTDVAGNGIVDKGDRITLTGTPGSYEFWSIDETVDMQSSSRTTIVLT